MHFICHFLYFRNTTFLPSCIVYTYYQIFFELFYNEQLASNTKIILVLCVYVHFIRTHDIIMYEYTLARALYINNTNPQLYIINHI